MRAVILSPLLLTAPISALLLPVGHPARLLTPVARTSTPRLDADAAPEPAPKEPAEAMDISLDDVLEMTMGDDEGTSTPVVKAEGGAMAAVPEQKDIVQIMKEVSTGEIPSPVEMIVKSRIPGLEKGKTADATLMAMSGISAECAAKPFDPLGLASDEFPFAFDTREEKLAWFRAAEIKHGRVAMAAVLGYAATANGLFFPGTLSYSEGLSFSDLGTNPIAAWDMMPASGRYQIIAFVGALEFWSEMDQPHYTKVPAIHRSSAPYRPRAYRVRIYAPHSLTPRAHSIAGRQARLVPLDMGRPAHGEQDARRRQVARGSRGLARRGAQERPAGDARHRLVLLLRDHPRERPAHLVDPQMSARVDRRRAAACYCRRIISSPLLLQAWTRQAQAL